MTSLVLFPNQSVSRPHCETDEFQLELFDKLFVQANINPSSSDPCVQYDNPTCDIHNKISLESVEDSLPLLEYEDNIKSSCRNAGTCLACKESHFTGLCDNNEKCQLSTVTKTLNSTKKLIPKQYGGLTNLGNTCYIAASLQLLASMDDFVDSMYTKGAALEGICVQSGNESILQLFVNMAQLMREGKTANPEKFKTILDKRTPYFIGFEQQDAHEFLTTILNLIEEEHERQNDTKANSKGDKTINTLHFAETEESDWVFVAKEARTESEPSAMKHPHKNASRSFTCLDVEAIEHLLNETSTDNHVPLTLATKLPVNYQPFTKCKLAGGRLAVSVDKIGSVAWYAGCDSHLSYPVISQDNASQPDSLAHDPLNALRGDLTSGNQETILSCGVPDFDLFFKTIVRVRLTCDSCKYARTQEETYLHLSLEISDSDPAFSIGDSLRQFFAPERRKIKCEKCFCETALQTNEIIKLPRALLLHLKRFVVDISPDYSTATYTKNQSPVILETEISLNDDLGLSEFISSDCSFPNVGDEIQRKITFELCSIVNHMGSSASCGHYTNDSIKKYERGEYKWTRFNDDNVTLISTDVALEDSKRTAYIVLYELRSSKIGGVSSLVESSSQTWI